MNLIDLRTYIEQRKLVPLQDIAHHFRTEIETIRPMLQVWMNKGKLKRYKNTTGCKKGCCACDPATIETYEWIAGDPKERTKNTG